MSRCLTFGLRMVQQCGIIGADARPNWHEQPERRGDLRTPWE
jgi:hypothetical protein